MAKLAAIASLKLLGLYSQPYLLSTGQGAEQSHGLVQASQTAERNRPASSVAKSSASASLIGDSLTATMPLPYNPAESARHL
jgi:hypothetical protein